MKQTADIDSGELPAEHDFSQLTQALLACAHRVDRRTIRRWTELGMPRRADGRYNLVDTIHWRSLVSVGGFVNVERARSEIANRERRERLAAARSH